MALTKVTGQVINNTTGLVVGVTTVGGGVSATDGFFSGIVTAVGNASFSGNVSVGGTLTYEDVTNIDAVGLVTARNGIVVGSGITLSKDGDGFFTGVVTATSYAGDGSALTGIAATDNVRTGILDVAGIATFRDDVIVGTGVTLSPDGDAFFTGVTTATTLRIQDGEISSYVSQSGTLLTVEDTGDSSIEIASGHNNTGSVFFGDTGSSNKGQINYLHGSGGDLMTFQTNGGERLRIGSAGEIGIAGANYGTSGQFLQSQGSGSVIQWASAPTWTQQSISTVQSGTEHEMTGIPSTAKEVMIRFDGISGSGSGSLMFVLGNSGGYVTSGYIISAGYHPNENYVKRTDSIKFHGVNSDGYIVTGRVHLWYPVHSANWWVEGVAFPDDNEGRYQHRVTGQANSGGTLTKIKMTLDNSASFDNTGNGKVQLSYLTY